MKEHKHFPTMNVRPALSSDVDAIARTHVLGWQHAYGGILSPNFLASLSVEQRARMWAEAIEKQVQRLLVVEVAGQVSGFVAFGPCRDDGAHATDFEVWAIYLHPQFIGSGAGQALWLGSLAAMKRRGATRVTLWVLAKNEVAIRFYRAAGFTEDAESRKSIQVGGVPVVEVRYSQNITG